ncbi:MAG TPA: RNA polymerase subunit sigma [Gammaproteobacteria bacterium]|nr:RNA polymerase subunit sigma [Gammaproteobacteria bacterium]
MGTHRPSGGAATPMNDRRRVFEGLIRDHGPDLYRFAHWLCGQPQVAEDLLQETFARARHALSSPDDLAAARAWLFVTLHREHARVCERQRPQGVDSPPGQIPQPQPTLDDRPEASALRRALAVLAPEYRDPLLLQVLGGLSCEEIGAALGLTPQTTATRVFRARRRLRAALGEESGRQGDET